MNKDDKKKPNELYEWFESFCILMIVVFLIGAIAYFVFPQSFEDNSSKFIVPKSKNSYLNFEIYNKMSVSKNHEIKISCGDIYMINDSVYMATMILDESHEKKPSYNLYISTDKDYSYVDRQYSQDSSLKFYMCSPNITYTNEAAPYVIVKDKGEFEDNGSNGKTHVYICELYVPEHGLQSMPYDKGKYGVDQNIKIS